MNNQDSFDRAQKDVYDMMNKWADDGVLAEESLFAALPILIRAVFEMAPTTKAAHGMLAVCFQDSYNPEDVAS